MVYYHLSGMWTRQKTSGEVPIRSLYATAVVRYDKMCVLGGRSRDDHDPTTKDFIGVVHILDLNTWNWTKFTPDGSSPTQDRYGSRTSWLYQGKIYVLGGCSGTLFSAVTIL